MQGQLSIQDFAKPDYKGKTDEIMRMSIEQDFTLSLKLQRCQCSKKPQEYFRSCHEYFVKCDCGRKTKMYKHLYEAIQAWNRGIYDKERST